MYSHNTKLRENCRIVIISRGKKIPEKWWLGDRNQKNYTSNPGDKKLIKFECMERVGQMIIFQGVKKSKENQWPGDRKITPIIQGNKN